MTNNWFEVSIKGLRELQAGKPKHHIVRELIQNAFDEDIKKCELLIEFKNGIAEIIVKDDNPEGFKDLSHAFTLFAPTYKRTDSQKRGRFNMGEKQAITISEKAEIKTTKGTIIFNKKGRIFKKDRTEIGSQISLSVRMTKKEFEDIFQEVKTYLPPKGIIFSVNSDIISYQTPYKVIQGILTTEVDVDNVFKKVERNTSINIFKVEGKARLYELGLPITEIDCEFNIDVQQKVPLSLDRETVPQGYLEALYALVLNSTYQDITEENSSAVWIREATSNCRISPEAVKEITNKRFGDKVVIANPFDKNSIDEAISNGYKVVYGSELSSKEWENVRKAEAMKTSSDLFGSNFVNSTRIKPNDKMIKVAELSKKIAKRCLGINIIVNFSKWEGNVSAQYGNRTLTFNVSSLGEGFFNQVLSDRILNLIVHELGHELGNHTEKSYHECITKMTGELIIIALEEPQFFNV